MLYKKNKFAVLLVVVLTIALMSIAQSQDTWIPTNGPTRGNANVLDMAVGRASGDANATVYDMEGTFIKYSLNGGSTWNTAGSLGGNPLAITCKPTTPSRVVGGINYYVYYSNNNGLNWTITNIENDLHVVPIYAATSKPSSSENVMFLGIQKFSTFSSMKRSYDGGINWQDVGSFFGDIQTDVTALAPHPTNAQIAFAGGTTAPPRTLLTGGQSATLVEPLPTYTNGVFYSVNAGVDWYHSGNLAKNVKALATYTSSTTTYVFAATDDPNSRLKRSTNATSTSASWITVTAYSGGLISDIRVNQNNVIFVSATDGVYKSTNNGTSWMNLSGNGFIDPTNMKRLGIDPQNASIVFAGSTTNLCKSTDAGATWRDAAPSNSFLSTSAVAANGSINLALPSNYSVVERNIGSGWYPVGIGINDFRGKAVGFRTSAGTVAFATGYHDVGGGSTKASIFRSTNSGDYTWAEVKSGTYTSGKYNGITVDPVNSERIYAFGLRQNGTPGSNENISVSIDGGGVWERGNPIPNNSVTTISEIADFTIDSSNHGSNNYSLKLFAAIFTGNTADKGVWKSIDAGTTWGTVPVLAQPIRSLGFNTAVPLIIYAAGGDATNGWQIWKSTNSGSSWSIVPSVTFEVKQILMHPSYPNSSNYLWIVKADGQSIYKTNNGGSYWNEINTTNIPKPINDLRSDLSSNSIIYAATASGVYKINPAPEPPTGFIVRGTNCTAPTCQTLRGSSGSLTPGSCYPILSWSANVEADISTSGTYELERNIDNTSWDCIATGIGLSVTDIEVALSSTGIHNVFYRVRAKDAAGNFSGYTNTICVMASTIPLAAATKQMNMTNDQAVYEFKLFSNHPNPFNPVTTISYSIPEDAKVSLKVYNFLGQVVMTLVDEVQIAGNKSVEFDASKLPSGVYLYRIQAGKFTDVKKMLLVK